MNAGKSWRKNSRASRADAKKYAAYNPASRKVGVVPAHAKAHVQKPDEPGSKPDPVPASGEDDFRWLPRSRVGRVLIGLGVVAFVAFVFDAYLGPNMVFELANMVFCG